MGSVLKWFQTVVWTTPLILLGGLYRGGMAEENNMFGPLVGHLQNCRMRFISNSNFASYIPFSGQFHLLCDCMLVPLQFLWVKLNHFFFLVMTTPPISITPFIWPPNKDSRPTEGFSGGLCVVIWAKDKSPPGFIRSMETFIAIPRGCFRSSCLVGKIQSFGWLKPQGCWWNLKCWLNHAESSSN